MRSPERPEFKGALRLTAAAVFATFIHVAGTPSVGAEVKGPDPIPGKVTFEATPFKVEVVPFPDTTKGIATPEEAAKQRTVKPNVENVGEINAVELAESIPATLRVYVRNLEELNEEDERRNRGEDPSQLKTEPRP